MAKSAPMPVAQIAIGRTLHRIHGAGVGARWYGRKDATWRWDDPDRGFGVLYLGKSAVGPFAESLLRTPGDRNVLWDRVEQKRMATLVTRRPLKLAKLHGPGLAWFETTAAEISSDDLPAGYAAPQAIAARVHDDSKLDGIQYRSRFDTDELCVALFERADGAIDLVTEGGPISKSWVKALLRPRGYRLTTI